MQQNLEKYNSNDFLNDDSFINWIKGDDNLSDFWDSYKNSNPKNLDSFTDAENLIRAMLSVKEVEVDEEHLNEILIRITDKIDQSPKKVKLFTIKLLRYAAAILLPVFILTGIYYFNRKGQNDLALKAVNHQSATLILSDGTTIALGRGNKNRSVKDASGAPILLDSSSINYELNDNSTYQAYNIIETPRGGEYKLVLDDGTQIWINSETRLKYPVHTASKGDRIVYLEKGEVYFTVTKNKKAPFFVKMNGMQIQVLGTSFNINTFNNKIVTTLEEGSVKISRDNIDDVYLKPGEQTVYESTTGILNKSSVDTYPFTSWKSGWLVFNDNSLEEVMEQIGRWYDLEIEFTSDEIKLIRFGGKLRKSKDVRDMLNVIAQANDFKAVVAGGKIMLSPKE